MHANLSTFLHLRAQIIVRFAVDDMVDTAGTLCKAAEVRSDMW